MAEPTALADEPDPSLGGAAAALAAVFAASPVAQALFDASGRCAAASPGFSRAAAAAADAAGRLSADFLAGADVRDIVLEGSVYRLVTLPAPAATKIEAPALPPVLRALLNAIPAAINAKDRDLRYLFMNKYQADFWRMDAAEAVGKTTADLGRNQSPESAEYERRVVETGKAIPFFDENLVGLDGILRDWLVTKMPLRDPATGEALGVATFALDISDRKRLEAMMLSTKKAAEGASQAKTMFLAQVSHELRTPLNAIIGFTEMMTQEIFGPLGAPQYHGYAGDVLKAARHLLSIITDMLDVTRLDAGALALELTPVGPNDVVAEAARMVAPAAAGKRIQLRQFAPNDLPKIKADVRRLKQAFINLLANAVKFTPEGGTVGFGASRFENGVEVYVEDSGIGMNQAEIDIALTVFGRVNEGYAKAQEGTGIGLPLAKALIERHGGRFAIESTPGKGTKIRAIFPESCLESTAPNT